MDEKDRDRLAEWMGWELHPIRGIEANGSAWHDGDEAVMLPEHWQPDIDGNDMLMLLERAVELGLSYNLYWSGLQRFASCYFHKLNPGDAITPDRQLGNASADKLPEAVAGAVLTMIGKEMLEATE